MFIGEKYNELDEPNLGIATLDNEQFNTMFVLHAVTVFLVAAKYHDKHVVLLHQCAPRSRYRVQCSRGEFHLYANRSEYVPI